jgi:DNA-binding helix-hairpin-helix protein with protein kinase domain
MLKYKGLSGIDYLLDEAPINKGGEGTIMRVIGPGKMAAKIYHTDLTTRDLQEKLIRMSKRPPSPEILRQSAWPLDVLYDAERNFKGFAMPELKIDLELAEVYRYPSSIDITLRQKCEIAKNICGVINDIHAKGFVFGDFNPRNIGVNLSDYSVGFLDTDSYHVKHENKTYRCNVSAPGYTAPELISKCAAHLKSHPGDADDLFAATPLPTFTKETDHFALAIHIFKLLMNGYSPFGGINADESVSQASPGTGDTAVARDSYCFKPGSKPQSVAVPPLNSLSEELGDMFSRAFIYGRISPMYRPNAKEWLEALRRYEDELVDCSANYLHSYHKRNTGCPLCAADERFSELTGQTIEVPVPTPVKIPIPPHCRTSRKKPEKPRCRTIRKKPAKPR